MTGGEGGGEGGEEGGRRRGGAAEWAKNRGGGGAREGLGLILWNAQGLLARGGSKMDAVREAARREEVGVVVVTETFLEEGVRDGEWEGRGEEIDE